jgi:ribonucleoside-diphosphate reductase alpha chain
MWINDIFMERVEKDQMWTLFSPDTAVGLANTYGAWFNKLYEEYEQNPHIPKKQVPARKVWEAILVSQLETGTPYMMYKDACNSKSNQKHLGTIQCSNLCTEIIEYTSHDEIAVCNLASIALPTCVVVDNESKTHPVFDFSKLYDTTFTAAWNCDTVIDLNYYALEETKNSNFRHRPIGLGVQGLADTFILMGFDFESPEAMKLNVEIFETMYFAALCASLEKAKKYGSYSSFHGSPVSKGVLQFDMWGVQPSTSRHDWTRLKSEIQIHGLRNSLLLAPMPTASTSQLLGFNECIEPITSNIFVRRTMAGEFICFNKYLIHELQKLGLYDEQMVNELKRNYGSIQNITRIPQRIKNLFKTAYEISTKTQVDLMLARAPFIDQSQSFNVWLAVPDMVKLSRLHMYAWKKGSKTSMYYCRTHAAVEAQQFTVQKDSSTAVSVVEESKEKSLEIIETLQETSSVEQLQGTQKTLEKLGLRMNTKLLLKSTHNNNSTNDEHEVCISCQG